MEITGQFFLVCAVWCFLDQVHSIPTETDLGLSPLSPTESSPLSTSLKECGKSKKTDANKLPFVKGQDAILGDWPWMVGLFRGELTSLDAEFQCGGSLISKQWIITAASCVFDKCTKNLFVRLGDLNIDRQIRDGATPLDAELDRIIPHPHYSKDSPIQNEIALIRMKTPVHFTDNIRPICLFRGPKYLGNDYYNGKKPYIIGWGHLEWQSGSFKSLQEASVNVVSHKKCVEQRDNIDDKIICAARPVEDLCQDDTGGPLMFFNGTERRFYLGGIRVGGIGCPNEDYSGLYTKVAQFISWISFTTRESF